MEAKMSVKEDDESSVEGKKVSLPDETQVVSTTSGNEATTTSSTGAEEEEEEEGDEDTKRPAGINAEKEAASADGKKQPSSPRGNDQDYLEKKRKMNIIYSRRKRLKKKKQVETLQANSTSLQQKNAALRNENARLERLTAVARVHVAQIEDRRRSENVAQLSAMRSLGGLGGASAVSQPQAAQHSSLAGIEAALLNQQPANALAASSLVLQQGLSAATAAAPFGSLAGLPDLNALSGTAGATGLLGGDANNLLPPGLVGGSAGIGSLSQQQQQQQLVLQLALQREREALAQRQENEMRLQLALRAMNSGDARPPHIRGLLGGAGGSSLDAGNNTSVDSSSLPSLLTSTAVAAAPSQEQVQQLLQQQQSLNISSGLEAQAQQPTQHVDVSLVAGGNPLIAQLLAGGMNPSEDSSSALGGDLKPPPSQSADGPP